MTGRVLLISANTFREPYPVYPLALTYLSTYIRRNMPQYDVSLFDCNLGSKDDLQRHIRETEPSYVCISLRNVDGANSLADNDFLRGFREVAAAVREVTSVPVVIGGSAFSIFPGEFMTLLEADYGITGEGEESLRQLICTLDEGGDPSGIEGLVVRDGDGWKANPHRCYLSALEADFDGRLAEYYWKYSGMLNIQTKRGCPYNCIYCSYPTIDGRRVRTLDAGQVAENIIRLKRDKGIDYFFFTDSVFNIADGYNAQLAQELIRSGAGISWGAYFSPNNVSREKMELYKASGLTHVEYGSESFSDECLAAYGKEFTFDQVLAASQVCLDLNIYYSHFLILGGHGETRSTLRETMENSRKIDYSVFFPYAGMRIYPDTELHRIAVEGGVVDSGDDLFAPKYYLAEDFDLEYARALARETGKAWIFPDEIGNEFMDMLRLKRNKKGPLWEYLRRP